ncbi:unnamed protein product [Gongylonema pulchrum]|uniref:Uncharacterized protein n=1 Tax=Gongylonema pulchrum TaxID=637853 RepID=A0A183D8H7_9BILA|nr:unnamed protein product [Gongylonema pulchrum]
MGRPSKMGNKGPAEQLCVYRRCQSVPSGFKDKADFCYKPRNFRSCTVDRDGAERQQQMMEAKFQTRPPLQDVIRSRSRIRRIKHELCSKPSDLV